MENMKFRVISISVAIAVLLLAGTALAIKVYTDRGPVNTEAFRATYYETVQQPANGSYGGCGGSCCSSGGPAGQQANKLEIIKKQAADYYAGKYKDNDFTVEVKDFGCHQEAYILKSGQQVKRLSISGGNIYEVG